MTDSIERAPSGRAKCRACRQPVAKDELRFGEVVPNPYGEGEAHFWYHLRCAALRLPEKFNEALKASSDVPGETSELLSKVAANAQRHARLVNVMRADRAPTGRARCQSCREGIDKGAWRIVLERMDEGISSSAGFLHVRCAAQEMGQAELFERLQYCEPPLTAEERSDLVAQTQ
ncbi:MAG TPA: hypothetical protein VHO25_14765 [Polyangiaceae bacterium]|nr:hypothetical protein [Polyangiaceae bacterium]